MCLDNRGPTRLPITGTVSRHMNRDFDQRTIGSDDNNKFQCSGTRFLGWIAVETWLTSNNELNPTFLLTSFVKRFLIFGWKRTKYLHVRTERPYDQLGCARRSPSNNEFHQHGNSLPLTPSPYLFSSNDWLSALQALELLGITWPPNSGYIIKWRMMRNVRIADPT